MARRESLQGNRPPRLEYYKGEDDQQVRKKAIVLLRSDLAYYTSHLTLLTGSPEDPVSISVDATQKWNTGIKRGESRDPFTFAMIKKDVRDMILNDLGLPLHLKPIDPVLNDTREGNMPPISGRFDRRRSIMAQLETNARRGDPTFRGRFDRENIKRIQEVEDESHSFKVDKATIMAIQDVGNPLGVEEQYIRTGILLGLKESLETRYNEVGIRFATSVGNKEAADPEKTYESVIKDIAATNSSIFVIHFSDGDTRKFDVSETLEKARVLDKISEMFGFIFIPSRSSSESSLSEVFRVAMKNEIINMTIRNKNHVHAALVKYLSSYL